VNPCEAHDGLWSCLTKNAGATGLELQGAEDLFAAESGHGASLHALQASHPAAPRDHCQEEDGARAGLGPLLLGSLGKIVAQDPRLTLVESMASAVLKGP